MRISDWSSDVCSSDLAVLGTVQPCRQLIEACAAFEQATTRMLGFEAACLIVATLCGRLQATFDRRADALFVLVQRTEPVADRSEEQTSELQSLMRTSYAVFCMKKTQLYTTPERDITCTCINITLKTSACAKMNKTT